MSLSHTQANNFKLSRGISHYAKPSYGPDGFGRDSYVRIDNGGFTMANYPTAKGASDGMVPNHKFLMGMGKHSKGSPKTYTNASSAKKTTYKMNGTGRDTYIGKGNGGLQPNEFGHTSFDTILRKDQRSEKETTYEYL